MTPPDATRPEVEADPMDVCRCGDARRDHVNGTGRCRMPNDLTHGFMTCEKFRLHMTAQQAVEAEADFQARTRKKR